MHMQNMEHVQPCYMQKKKKKKKKKHFDKQKRFQMSATSRLWPTPSYNCRCPALEYAELRRH